MPAVFPSAGILILGIMKSLTNIRVHAPVDILLE